MENQGSGSGPGSGYSGRKPWEQHLNEAGARLEEELRRVVRYVDDEVVPEVRKNGSKALRIAAERLRALADQIDDGRAERKPPPTPPNSSNSEGTA